MMAVRVPHGTVRIDPVAQVVETVTSDGHRMVGTRADTDENRREAQDQGYPATADGVWLSLRDHEILHALLPALAFGEPSLVCRHESGAGRTHYADRLYEEALVISFQYYWNTGKIKRALEPFRAELPRWHRAFREVLLDLEAAA